jgi:hypothetical protein
VNRPDVREAVEINGIKRKHTLDRIDAHNGNQPCVIDLDAAHLVSGHDLLPRAVDRRDVRQQRQRFFNVANLLQRLFRRQSQPVPVSGTRGNIPEFSGVLRAKKDLIFLPD